MLLVFKQYHTGIIIEGAVLIEEIQHINYSRTYTLEYRVSMIRTLFGRTKIPMI